MKSAKEKVWHHIIGHSEQENGLYIFRIARELSLSYSTVHKWVQILELENRIITRMLGGMRVIKVNKNFSSGETNNEPENTLSSRRTVSSNR